MFMVDLFMFIMEWDEFPDNKLLKIFPALKKCVICSDKQKRRDCDSPTAHWPFYYYSFFFINSLKVEEPPMCIGCDEVLNIEHISLTCSDLIEIRESHFTAQSLLVLFQDIPPEKIFNFLKEMNTFGKI